MKYIIKNREPVSLTKYRNTTPNASYTGYPAKNHVRNGLLDEQEYICAYCMQRISADYNKTVKKPKTEIEHYRSQHRHSTLALDYKNMLGVCNGNADKPSHKLICDKAKSEYDKTHDLTINPQDILRVNQIKYSAQGEIFTSIESIDYDLDTILNLNEDNLKQDRANLYRNIRRKIKGFWAKAKGNRATVKKMVESELNQWLTKNADGKFRELTGVALYLLYKEQKKLQT